MKVKCPTCGETLYTNPFQSSAILQCPKCKGQFQLNEASTLLLRSFRILDVVGDAIASGIIAAFSDLSTAAVMLFLFILIGYVFELPQRTLNMRGLLVYESSTKGI